MNGGAGNDAYLLDDKDDAIDTIEDADGKGSIKLGQTLITGKFGQAAQNKSELYFTADYQYQLRDLKNGTWRLYRNNGNNTYRAL